MLSVSYINVKSKKYYEIIISTRIYCLLKFLQKPCFEKSEARLLIRQILGSDCANSRDRDKQLCQIKLSTTP